MYIASLLLLLLPSSSLTTIEQRRSALQQQHNLDQELCTHVWNNDIEKTKQHLQRGAVPNIKCNNQQKDPYYSNYDPYYSRQCTAIFYATHALSLNLLSILLIDDHPNVGIPRDTLGMTPLHYIVDPYITMMHVHKCVLRGHLTNCTTLSSSKAMDVLAIALMDDGEVDEVDEEGNTITSKQVSYRSFVLKYSVLAHPIIDLLLKSYTNSKTEWTIGDHYGQTILHRASEGGVLSIVRKIYQHAKSLLNQLDSNGETPLDRAFQRQHMQVVYWLRDQGGIHGTDKEELIVPRLVALESESVHLKYYHRLQNVWSREKLILLNNFEVRPSSIPYPDIYGGTHEIEMNFTTYMSTMNSGYLFIKLTEDSKLWRTSDTLYYNKWIWMTPFWINNKVNAVQWSFSGLAGTGSPWHYHANSVTLLLAGEKKWEFLPPSNAIMSNVFNSSMQNYKKEKQHLISFTQYPGDLIFTTDRWAHRTFNVKEGTMGLTFEIETSLRPMEPIHVDYAANVEKMQEKMCNTS